MARTRRHFRHGPDTEYALEWQDIDGGEKWREVPVGHGTRHTMYGLPPGKQASTLLCYLSRYSMIEIVN
eukprot:tig00000403_g269.t1